MMMSRSRKLWIGLGVLGLSAFVLMSVYASANKGDKAPGFKLQSISNKYVTLDELRQNPMKKGATRPVIVTFWATWCPPCREEAATLKRLEAKYKSKGLEIIGVALDTGGIGDVAPFVKEHKLNYTILLDPDNKVAASLYNVRGIPSLYVLDKSGVIRNKYTGTYSGFDKDLEKDIQSVLR